MHQRAARILADRVFKLDPNAVVDTYDRFGTGAETVEALLQIPSLDRVGVPVQSILPADYLKLSRKAAWVTDHISVYPKHKLDSRGMLPAHGTRYNLRNRSGS